MSLGAHAGDVNLFPACVLFELFVKQYHNISLSQCVWDGALDAHAANVGCTDNTSSHLTCNTLCKDFININQRGKRAASIIFRSVLSAEDGELREAQTVH